MAIVKAPSTGNVSLLNLTLAPPPVAAGTGTSAGAAYPGSVPGSFQLLFQGSLQAQNPGGSGGQGLPVDGQSLPSGLPLTERGALTEEQGPEDAVDGQNAVLPGAPATGEPTLSGSTVGMDGTGHQSPVLSVEEKEALARRNQQALVQQEQGGPAQRGSQVTPPAQGQLASQELQSVQNQPQAAAQSLSQSLPMTPPAQSPLAGQGLQSVQSQQQAVAQSSSQNPPVTPSVQNPLAAQELQSAQSQQQAVAPSSPKNLQVPPPAQSPLTAQELQPVQGLQQAVVQSSSQNPPVTPSVQNPLATQELQSIQGQQQAAAQSSSQNPPMAPPAQSSLAGQGLQLTQSQQQKVVQSSPQNMQVMPQAQSQPVGQDLQSAQGQSQAVAQSPSLNAEVMPQAQSQPVGQDLQAAQGPQQAAVPPLSKNAQVMPQVQGQPVGQDQRPDQTRQSAQDISTQTQSPPNITTGMQNSMASASVMQESVAATAPTGQVARDTVDGSIIGGGKPVATGEQIALTAAGVRAEPVGQSDSDGQLPRAEPMLLQGEAGKVRLPQGGTQGNQAAAQGAPVSISGEQPRQPPADVQARTADASGRADMVAPGTAAGDAGTEGDDGGRQQRQDANGQNAVQQTAPVRSQVAPSAAQHVPAAQLQLLTPQWGQAVGERMIMMAQHGPRSAQIQLDPAELGAMQIRIHVQGQDQVSVSFTSPNPAVRDALEQQMPRLREMMAEQGLNLSEGSIFDQSGSGAREEQPGGSSGRSGGYAGQGDEVEVESRLVGSQALGLVDYYA